MLSPASSLRCLLHCGTGSLVEGDGEGLPTLLSSWRTVTLTLAATAPPGAASAAGSSWASSSSPLREQKEMSFLSQTIKAYLSSFVHNSHIYHILFINVYLYTEYSKKHTISTLFSIISELLLKKQLPKIWPFLF